MDWGDSMILNRAFVLIGLLRSPIVALAYALTLLPASAVAETLTLDPDLGLLQVGSGSFVDTVVVPEPGTVLLSASLSQQSP